MNVIDTANYRVDKSSSIGYLFYLLIGLVVLKSSVLRSTVDWFCLTLARLAYYVCSVFDETIVRQGSVLFTQNASYSVDITPACSALVFCLTIVTAVLTFKKSHFNSYIQVISCFLLLQCINIIRIISLVYLRTLDTDLFNFIHEKVWPVTFSVITATLFYRILLADKNRQSAS